MRFLTYIFCTLISLYLIAICGCATNYKKQNYAKLSTSMDFEEEYSIVWKGIRNALADFKIEKSNEENGDLQTDWVYSTSTDKFIEYKVNQMPRKKFLQTRHRFYVHAEKLYGRTQVVVRADEEVEDVNENNAQRSDTETQWNSVKDPDSARLHALLKKIDLAILSRHP